MPSSAILDVLARAPRQMDPSPTPRNPVVARADALRARWWAIEGSGPDVLYAYIYRWLADDADAPKLVAAPHTRQTLYPDGRDGTLLSSARDLSTAICALESIAPMHRDARWLAERLHEVYRAYLVERMEFLAEAIAHPRRRKFDALFVRLATSRRDVTALMNQRESTAHRLRQLDAGIHDDIEDGWLSYACEQALLTVACDYLRDALVEDDLDGARSVVAMYWDLLDDERRRHEAWGLSAHHLATWRRVLLLEQELGTEHPLSITPAAVLSPVPAGRLAAAWGIGDAHEGTRPRSVGLDMHPLEGEIIIATTAAQALARLRAYGERPRIDRDGDYLIGVERTLLPNIAAALREKGCVLRPVLATRQRWHGERFGTLVFGIHTAMWVDGQPLAVAFVAPLRGDTAATTHAGLRHALGRNPYMETVREIFGTRLDAVVMDRLESFPRPVADYGLPAPDEACPRFASIDDIAGDLGCDHAGAHWLTGNRSAGTTHLMLACPACLRTRLAVIEPHRIPEDSQFGGLRPEASEDADLDGYLHIVRRERVLLGDARPVLSWEQLVRDEPPVNLDPTLHVPEPMSSPAPVPQDYSGSLVEAFFG